MLAGYLMVSPQLAGFLVFVLLPLAAVVYYSVSDWNLLTGDVSYQGLANYERMLQDPEFVTVLRNSLVFAGGVVPLAVGLGLVLALLVNQRLPGQSFLRSVFFLPVVLSLVAWTIVWEFLLQDDGGINLLLQTVGIDGPNWLRGGGTAMVSVVVVQVLKTVGLNMVFFLAALQDVPRDLEEAAQLDGAGPWARFRHIVLPLIAPTTFLVTMITVIGSLKVFEQILLLTHGGPGVSTTVLVYYVYNQAFEFHDPDYASAVAVVLFGLVLALTVLQWRVRRRWVFHEQ